MQPLEDLLKEYLDARGLVITDGHDAKHVAEEAIELVAECSRDQPDLAKVMHEVADVVLAATVIAGHYGFTVEDAIAAKIALDRNREAAQG